MVKIVIKKWIILTLQLMVMLVNRFLMNLNMVVMMFMNHKLKNVNRIKIENPKKRSSKRKKGVIGLIKKPIIWCVLEVN